MDGAADRKAWEPNMRTERGTCRAGSRRSGWDMLLEG